VSAGEHLVGQPLFGEPNDMKDRQASKIKELADALVAAGFISLDDQATALGLSRSTTWTILKAKHKNYGLSAALIKRMLDKQDLHSQIRAKIIEYVREKAAGSYGHNHIQLRRFVRHVAGFTGTSPHDVLFAHLRTRPNLPKPGSARTRSVKITQRRLHNDSDRG
jgi:hypothetical protein